MLYLVVIGTVRNGRQSIHPAREIVDRLESRGHDVEFFDMAERDIPLLETRTYADPGEPPADVQEFASLVEACDGLIIVSPEYNHTMPGALKNLIDHCYPEYEDLPFSFVTVSAGGFGGVRLATDLRELALTLNAWPGPSLPVSNVGDIFSDDGALVDEEYDDRFESFLDDVEDHTERFADLA